ncbi:hypothetical protein SAMN04487891_1202 [Flagellimonas taeanensis]|uniref:Chaperone of endosialidase n=1 Tax=Flagellimonas taeanensis TaxID=1005926 RepID=A0A1M7CXZ9_9FLAO|nr:hypothetical protein [Allomuricauda taeanensis]SFC66612.1 hypothetical protein SAMN04487891_1202 [Allomuricauda taeanensis]SHL72114.1 hypothetical protein SAMN05216293_4140 [Allomuricauda taeanensis]
MKQMIFVLTLFCFSSRLASQDQVVNGKLTVSDKLVIDNEVNFPAEGSISETSLGNYILTNNSTSRSLRLGVSNDWYTRGEIEIENNNSPSSSIFFKTANANGGTNIRMKIAGNGRVGIGTTSPEALLDVKGSLSILNGAERLLWSSKHVGASDHRSYLAPRMSDDSAWDWNQEFGYHFFHRAWYFNGNVGIGTASPDAKLAVNGNIHAKEVKVDLTGWPDYVFTSDYDFPTLKEVEKHIKEKGHLINIPSAKEVEENGIELGVMNKLLLEKIEELTLYILEQEKRIKKLEKTMEQLAHRD